MIEDYKLLKQIQTGDQNALSVLIEKYYSQVFGYCFRFFHGQKETAEDVTQEIFLRLVKSIQHYRFTGKFFNYLFTITINCCRTTVTRKQVAQTEWQEEITEILPDEASNIDSAEQLAVQQLLDQLPEYQREVLLLRFYYDLKLTEIAQITHAKLPTVKSRLQQGLKKLRQSASEDVSPTYQEL